MNKKLLLIAAALFLITGTARSAEFEAVDRLRVDGNVTSGEAATGISAYILGKGNYSLLVASHTVGGYGLVVSSSGSVGIKMSTPCASYALDVGGVINGIDFYKNGSPFAQWGVTGTDIYYGYKVGIGPGFNAEHLPTSLLEIETNDSSGTQLELDNTDTGGRSWKLYSTGSGNVEGAGKFLIYDGDASGLRMLIDTAGNVGIGTTSPAANLHVREDNASDGVADITVENFAAGNATAKLFVKTNSATGSLAVYDDGHAGVGDLADKLVLMGDNSAAATAICNLTSEIQFYTGGVLLANRRMVIDAAGDVGIGTTNPGYKLEVAGTLGLKVNGTNTGALKVGYTSSSPAGYYAVYAP